MKAFQIGFKKVLLIIGIVSALALVWVAFGPAGPEEAGATTQPTAQGEQTAAPVESCESTPVGDPAPVQPSLRLEVGPSTEELLARISELKEELARQKAGREKAESQLRDLDARRNDLRSAAAEALNRSMEQVLKSQDPPQYSQASDPEAYNKTEREVDVLYLNSSVYVREFVPQSPQGPPRIRTVMVKLMADAAMLLFYDSLASADVDRGLKNAGLEDQATVVPMNFIQAWSGFMQCPIDVPPQPPQ